MRKIRIIPTNTDSSYCPTTIVNIQLNDCHVRQIGLQAMCPHHVQQSAQQLQSLLLSKIVLIWLTCYAHFSLVNTVLLTSTHGDPQKTMLWFSSCTHKCPPRNDVTMYGLPVDHNNNQFFFFLVTVGGSCLHRPPWWSRKQFPNPCLCRPTHNHAGLHNLRRIHHHLWSLPDGTWSQGCVSDKRFDVE